MGYVAGWIYSRETISPFLSESMLRNAYVLVARFNKRAGRGNAIWRDLEHAYRYLVGIPQRRVRAYIVHARTSKASREEVALGSGNDGANSAITEARTPRGFGTRLDRPLLEYSRSIVFLWRIDENVDDDRSCAKFSKSSL